MLSSQHPIFSRFDNSTTTTKVKFLIIFIALGWAIWYFQAFTNHNLILNIKVIIYLIQILSAKVTLVILMNNKWFLVLLNHFFIILYFSLENNYNRTLIIRLNLLEHFYVVLRNRVQFIFIYCHVILEAYTHIKVINCEFLKLFVFLFVNHTVLN